MERQLSELVHSGEAQRSVDGSQMKAVGEPQSSGLAHVPDAHTPEALHVAPPLHVPQVPPQPSLPHSRPAHDGVQPAWHWPAALQELPTEQVPQLPPHPSSPQTRPAHAGVQLPHCPAALQEPPPEQAPQLPPHPSEPHTRPVHSGTHPAASTLGPASTRGPMGRLSPHPSAATASTMGMTRSESRAAKLPAREATPRYAWSVSVVMFTAATVAKVAGAVMPVVNRAPTQRERSTSRDRPRCRSGTGALATYSCVCLTPNASSAIVECANAPPARISAATQIASISSSRVAPSRLAPSTCPRMQ